MSPGMIASVIADRKARDVAIIGETSTEAQVLALVVLDIVSGVSISAVGRLGVDTLRGRAFDVVFVLPDRVRDLAESLVLARNGTVIA